MHRSTPQSIASSTDPLRPMEGQLPHRPTYTDYGVTLQPIRNPVWRFILYALPWAILVALIVEIFSFTDWMFFTGQLAAALALFAFQMLMRQIPEVFDVLWSRNLIALKQNPNPDPSLAQEEASAATTDLQALTQRYADFLTGVEYSLNHAGSLILGFVFAGLGIARFPYAAGGLGVFLQRLPQRPSTYWEELLFEGFIGFILGLMAWRMIFTALQVSELDNRFDLRVRFDHPDRAGGLEPLGNLCLWNALILTIPGIFLGGWLIIWPRFPEYIYPNTGVFVYADLFYRLLLVPIVLAPVVFFLPLWSVHSLMARKAVVVRRDLDHLGERIDDLGRTLLSRADDLDQEQAERMTKSLDLMQQTYRANQNIPLWPLNVTILTKFATSQLVPLLGLTGLGQPVLKVVDALAKFLGQ